ncbi:MULTISPECIES: hypothetical protein [unclassified Geodermatophilus]
MAWLAITALGLVLEVALVIALGRAVTGREEQAAPPAAPRAWSPPAGEDEGVASAPPR